MKDSLILEGKVYISARRAAKIINYAQDYIGQLCRANKLDCKMVGRSWFVTEESLLAHRESAIDSMHEKVSKSVKNIDIETRLAIQQDALIKSKIVDDQNPVKYEAEKSPLLPELTKKIPAPFSLPKNIKIAPVVSSTLSVKSVPRSIFSPFIISSTRTAEAVATKSVSYNYFVTALVIGALLVSGFVFTSSLSGLKSGKSISYEPASVISATQDLFKKIAFNFGFGSSNVSSETIAQGNTNNWNGIGMIPSTNSVVSDEATKAKIKSSFSDEVVINPDQSGAAGIITPIFKKNDGDDFVYVLVPVKEGEKKQN